MADHEMPFSVARLGVPPNDANIAHIMEPLAAVDKPQFDAYLQVDQAHTVMLIEQGILTPEQGGKILAGLREIAALGADQFTRDPRFGSFLLQVERYLTARFGEDIAGRMHTGRSRNDHSTAVDRLFARDQLLRVLVSLGGLQDTMLRMAGEHLNTLMPGYTHLQHAQPTTLGHFLLRHYFTFERDQQRLEGTFARTNLSALGGAAMVGTSWPLNRERTAALLGHEGLVLNAADAGIFPRDYPAENAAMLAILRSNVGRLAGDLYLWSTWEFGMIEIDDGLAGTSSIMPQKKNPHSLERIRGISGAAIGWVPTLLGMLRSASSSDLDLFFGPDPIAEITTASLSALELLRTTLETLTIKTEVMRARAGIYWSTTSNLADELVRHAGISFRTAHHVVGRLVRNALEAKIGPSEVTTALLDQAAIETIGRPLAIAPEIVRDALDAEAFVHSRVTAGSANPVAGAAMCTEGRQRQSGHLAWLTEKQTLIAAARQQLASAAERAVAEGVSGDQA